jgi:alpha/beta superfamily hydrolase
MRTTLHTTGTSGKYAYFGVGSSPAVADLFGFGQGSAAAALGYNKGANISSAGLVSPRGLPALAAGDWLITVAKDETYVSFTLQPLGTIGQTMYGTRIPVSSFPGGVVNTMFLSANDTAVGGMNWGPVVFYGELAIPPSSAWTVGGVGLFGAGKPLVFQRVDPVTGCGHIICVPGSMDRRIPAPIVLFCHQGQSGVAASPWSDTRMAGVTAAIETGGYILVSSDNGPGIAGGTTQDKWGNQAGLDDYKAVVDWTRKHFMTGQLMLLGPSQGGLFALNLLRQRKLGGIAAAVLICPLGSLAQGESDPTYQASVWAAYGASDHADWVNKSKGFSPVDQPGDAFRGTPIKMYYGLNDTETPPATNQQPLITKVTPYAAEVASVTGPVDHLDPSLYQGANVVAFFDKYR